MSGLEPLAIAAIAGSAISAVGAVESGVAQGRIAEHNARLAEQDAAAQLGAAQVEETRARRGSKTLLAQQRAAYAKAGVSFEGSPLLVIARTAEEEELNALLIRHGGQIGARRSMGQAAGSRMAGSAARTGSYFQAGASLLNGATALSTIQANKAATPPTTVKRYGVGYGDPGS